MNSKWLGQAAVLFSAIFWSSAPGASPSQTPRAADIFAANIDASVSPRDDFFQYANGAWLKRNPVPPDQSRVTLGYLAGEEVYTQLREISEAAAATNAAPGTAESLIGALWATGTDTATINAQGLTALQPDLDRIARMQSIGDLIDVVATFHRRRMLIDDYVQRPTVIFSGDVTPDDLHSDRNIYALAPNGTSIGRAAYTEADSRAVTMRGALREYVFRTALRLGRDNDKARSIADTVIDVEARLATRVPPNPETRRMSVTELAQAMPTFDWGRYFTAVGAGKVETVTVRNLPYFRSLDAGLRDVSLDAWKDYLRFWLVKVNAPFLDDGTYGEFFAFKSAASGQREPRARWRRVVWQEKHWFGLPARELWVGKYFSQRTVPRYIAIGESVRRAFRERIARLPWMSEATKRGAIRKLAQLTITIGYPDQKIDFSRMPLRRDSYVLNMIRSAEWFHAQEMQRLNDPAADRGADLHPGVDDDAEYDSGANEARIQRPVSAPGWRDQDLDDAFVYGATLLAHEVAHALDSEGRHYDADGLKRDWWTSADAAAFDQRAAVLAEQYSGFEPLPGRHINGKASLRENMADLVGLRIALDAFKQTAQFKAGRRVGGFTPLQRFFLAYAYAHAGQMRPEALASSLNGPYAPDRERVNGVLMNIPEFYEAFGVKPGDAMYRSESARVSIW